MKNMDRKQSQMTALPVFLREKRATGHGIEHLFYQDRVDREKGNGTLSA